MNKNKAIIVSVIIVAVTIIASFYILNFSKTTSPVSSDTNQALVASGQQPSKILKEYSDSSGFSFKYPQDVQVNKKDITNDATAYANLEIVGQAKGSMSIKVLDTKFKTVDDWFLENKSIAIKEIKIGEISGKEANANNKITAVGLDQNVLFIMEVDTQNQKYWQSVYSTILSSFNFLTQEKNSVPEAQLPDETSGDAILEEEVIE